MAGADGKACTNRLKGGCIFYSGQFCYCGTEQKHVLIWENDLLGFFLTTYEKKLRKSTVAQLKNRHLQTSSRLEKWHLRRCFYFLYSVYTNAFFYVQHGWKLLLCCSFNCWSGWAHPVVYKHLSLALQESREISITAVLNDDHEWSCTQKTHITHIFYSDDTCEGTNTDKNTHISTDTYR